MSRKCLLPCVHSLDHLRQEMVAQKCRPEALPVFQENCLVAPDDDDYSHTDDGGYGTMSLAEPCNQWP